MPIATGHVASTGVRCQFPTACVVLCSLGLAAVIMTAQHDTASVLHQVSSWIDRDESTIPRSRSMESQDNLIARVPNLCEPQNSIGDSETGIACHEVAEVDT